MHGVLVERDSRALLSPTLSATFDNSSEPPLNQAPMPNNNRSSSPYHNADLNSPPFLPSTSPIPVESVRSGPMDLPSNETTSPSPRLRNHMDATTLHEHSSVFDQESRIDFPFGVLSLAEDSEAEETGPQPPPKQQTETRKEREMLTLKEQEKTIDSLNKENFELKLKIYFLEKRLNELSPDQVDHALKENVDLKVHTQTLLRELKKYKKMILEQNKAMEILERNQFCTKPHGMTVEEQQNYKKALATAAQQQQENTRLHKVVADVSAENARLRASILRSPRSSSPLTGPLKSSPSDGHGSPRILAEDGDNDNDWQSGHHRRIPSSYRELVAETETYRRELALAKQTIEMQNQTIQLLREDCDRPGSGYSTGEDHILKSILHERDTLVATTEHYIKTNIELQEHVALLRGRNTDAVAKLTAKNKELDRIHANMDELGQALHEAEQQLRTKVNECQKLKQELSTLRDRQDLSLEDSSEIQELYENLDDLRRENAKQASQIEKLRHRLQEEEYVHQAEIEKLVSEIEQREQEFASVEEEMVKLVARTDKLAAHEQEKDALIEALKQKLGRRSWTGDDDELEHLEEQLRLKDEQIAEYEQRVMELENNEDVAAALEAKIVEMEAEIRDKDEYIQQIKEELNEAFQKAFEAKKNYEEDLRELETQFQQVEHSIRDRDVQIASLEGELEAQTDAIQREKAILQEEIKDLQEEMRDIISRIHEKDMELQDMQVQLAGARSMQQAYEEDIAALKEQMTTHMIHLDETWRAKVTELEKRLESSEIGQESKSSNGAGHGTQKATGLNHQNRRSSETKHGLRTSEAQHKLLHRLNQRVQQEPRDQTPVLQKLVQENHRKDEENLELRQKIESRESLIARLMEELRVTHEKQPSPGVPLHQATNDRYTHSISS